MDPGMSICPSCHMQVRMTDFYCFNCGHNLHEPPPSLFGVNQILLYVGSVLVPPMGIFWALKYLRSKDTNSRIIGWIAVGLTVLAVLFYVKQLTGVINEVSKQAGSLNSLQGY